MSDQDLTREEGTEVGVVKSAEIAVQPCGGESYIALTGKSALNPAKQALWVNIPQGLRDRAQWCVATHEYKRPLTPAAGLPAASPTDPTTWRCFQTACKFAVEFDLDIGYMLHADDPFTCIDIDVKTAVNQPDLSKRTTEEDIARFERIIEHFDCYTERSRSGVGFHIWMEGKIGKGNKGNGLEIYSQWRFMICTGDVFRAAPVRNRQLMLDCLLPDRDEASNASEATLDDSPLESDDALLERAHKAENAIKFAAHFSGNWAEIGHDDHSRADMALMGMLAFYSKHDEQVKRIFLRSALGKREKAIKRKDYLDRTLQEVRLHQRKGPNAEHGKLIAERLMARVSMKTAQVVSSSIGSPDLLLRQKLRLISAEEIAARAPMKWLVRSVLPKSGVGAIFGPPGSGKSFLVLDLLAAVATGATWFDIPTKEAPVVYISLEGQGGLQQRVQAYRQRKGGLDKVAFIDQALNLLVSDEVNQLVNLVLNSGFSGGVLCIDTLAASAPGIDENASTDMGKLISVLQKVQAAVNGLVLIVHHTGKDAERGLRGWSGLNGALDCAIKITRAPDSRKDDRRRWEVTKSKDGQDGIFRDFCLVPVALGYDDDGFLFSSCIVANSVPNKKTAAEVNDEIDDFIFDWVKRELDKGNFPSGRSLEGQRNQMLGDRKITQAEMRNSINRLVATKRLFNGKHSGNNCLLVKLETEGL